MKITTKIKSNGKPCIHINRETNGTRFLGIKRIPFHIKRDNLFITELRVNSRIPERKFVISIRNDGKGKNDKEYILSQMNFNEVELLQLRDSINNIIYYKL
jgi:hypothetical protein